MTILYRYKARTAAGKYVTGQEFATDPTILTRVLQTQNLYLIAAHKITSLESKFLKYFIHSGHLQEFCFHLQLLLQGGIPLLMALEMVQEQVNSGHFKSLLMQIISKIKQGRQLADVLSDYPKIFNAVFINIVRTGEYIAKLS